LCAGGRSKEIDFSWKNIFYSAKFFGDSAAAQHLPSREDWPIGFAFAQFFTLGASR
jgi:hypothetical protein